MVDLDSITIDVKSIKREGDMQVVTMETSYREGTSFNLMTKATKTRARARALIATGVINTTLKNIRGSEIQRFTKVRSFDDIKSIGGTHKAKIVVEVTDSDEFTR